MNPNGYPPPPGGFGVPPPYSPGSPPPGGYGAPPGGFGAPPPGGFGAPPPGGFGYPPPGPPFGPYAHQQAIGGMAIAALITSLSSFICGLSAPIGLILGLVELGRIRRGESSPRGRGLALAGAIIGGIFSGLMVVYLVVVLIAAIAG